MNTSENYVAAVNELRTAKNVDQWNEIRSRHSKSLTAIELTQIDSSGLIVEVLGHDYVPPQKHWGNDDNRGDQ